MFGMEGVTAILLAVATIGVIVAVLLGPLVGVRRDFRRGNKTRMLGWSFLWLGIVAGWVAHAAVFKQVTMDILQLAVRVGNTVAPYEAYLYPILLVGVGAILLLWQSDVDVSLPSLGARIRRP